MNIRKEINSLSEQELLELREALVDLQSFAGNEGYQYLSGLHGLPNPSNCPHHLPEFLPWHRLYLNNFETALQSFNPQVTLPYWDWSSSIAITEGIPEILKEPKFINSEGVEVNNPLSQARVEFENRDTSRNPRNSSELEFLANQVEVARDESIFYSQQTDSDFTSALEMPHDWLHGWIRGDMGRVAYSAYDPIFWLHHCNIDRFWAEWQVTHPEIILSDNLLNISLPVYSKLIRETIDFKALGITYDTLQEESLTKEFVPFSFDSPLIDSLPVREKNITLIVDGLKMTQDTFELRFFVNKNGEFDDSVSEKGFAGSVFLLGMSGAKNPRGFMGKFKRIIDLRKALSDLGEDQVNSISVRGFDELGNKVSVENITPQLSFKVNN